MQPESTSGHRLARIGFLLLVLSGLGFLFSVTAGYNHGLRAWLLPFGPWSIAILIHFVILRPQGDQRR